MGSDSQSPPFHISGVVPSLAVKANMMPKRSETGIGALMPWADKLWMVTYPSHKSATGSGTGLFEIDDEFTLRKRPESLVGTHANRLVHVPSNQLFIGCYCIDVDGGVRVIPELNDIRITATAEHLHDPENMVYFLGMEGELYEVNVHSLEVAYVADVNKELGIHYLAGTTPHFKGAHTAQGRLVVANNSFFECDWQRTNHTGRLGEWDGKEWRSLDTGAFLDVAGRRNWGRVIFANGWDRTSCILKVCVDGRWQTYRLPKASLTWEHAWQTEWPRIREMETERYMMDNGGMIYELSPVAWSGRIWGVKPVCQHIRITPDFCSWNGLLVMAGNQTTPNRGGNAVVGQPQAGLWFGKSDDLWSWGKPAGWGGVWWKDAVQAGRPSDPYLMTGFEHKGLHLTADAAVGVTCQVDFLGDGSWADYEIFKVPAGFSAHWVRLVADTDCIATGCFNYT